MVTLGFIVEGPSDKIVVESDRFSKWLNEQGLRLGHPVVVAGGQVRGERLEQLSQLLRLQGGIFDRVVLMTDLDPDEDVPCISARKAVVQSANADLVVVANKAIESWFLADSSSMRDWTKDPEYFEANPEETPGMPWDRLKEIGVRAGRGPGSKVSFAKRFLRKHGFTIVAASEHPNCPSARYFIDKVAGLGTGRQSTGT